MTDSEPIMSPLIEPGVIRVKTKDDFTENATISTSEADDYTRKVNQPDVIWQRFLDIPHIYKKTLPSWACVITHVPSGQYSPGALQTIAIRPEIMQHKPVDMIDGRMKTLSIFDFPHDAQIEYFRQILANIHAIKAEYGQYSHDRFTVMFSENAAATVSTLKHRVARTVAEPHSQQWIINGSVKPFDQNWRVPRLLKHERNIIKAISHHLANGLSELAQELAAEKITGHLRQAAPHGYIIDTKINEFQETQEQAQVLTKILHAHHLKYQEKATTLEQELLDSRYQTFKKLMLPQPSYKIFGLFNQNGNLEISIAPTLFAQTGVVEALDIVLSRRSEHPALFASEQHEDAYFLAVQQRIQQTGIRYD